MERRLPRLLPRFKLHATVLALLALALLVAALGPRARAQERRPVDEVPQSRVFGRIVDSKGAAVSGAKVELRAIELPWRPGEPRDCFETSTDDSGQFELSVPTPTSDGVVLSVRSNRYLDIATLGCGPAGGRGEPRLKSGDNDLRTLTLKPAGALTGRVTDERDQPISGALVRLAGKLPRDMERQTRSNERGEFELAHVPAGTYSLEAQADGFRGAKVRDKAVVADKTTAGIDLMLFHAMTISGIVVDESGVGVANARVWGCPKYGGRGAGARTDADGRFVVQLLQNHPHRFDVEAEGFAKLDSSFEELERRELAKGRQVEQGSLAAVHRELRGYCEPGSTDVRLVLDRPALTRFVVLDAATSAPVPEFALTLEWKPIGASSRKGGEPTFLRDVHPDGEFECEADPRRHTYLIVAQGYAPARGEIVHDPADTRRCVVRLSKGGSLIGQVLVGGKPVEGADVILRETTLEELYEEPVADENQAYWWELEGVFDPFWIDETRRKMRSDGEGRFRFESLDEGDYRLEIKTKLGDRRSMEPVKIALGVPLDLGNVELLRAATLQGRVLVPPGTSPAKLQISASVFDVTRFATTDALGQFRIPALPAGRAHVHISDEPGVLARFRVRHYDLAPDETKDVLLDATGGAGASISIVARIDGKPAVGLDACAVSVVDSTLRARLGRTRNLGATKEWIPAIGECSVEFFAPSRMLVATLPKAALLTPGADVKLDLDLSVGQLAFEWPTLPPEERLRLVEIEGRHSGRNELVRVDARPDDSVRDTDLATLSDQRCEFSWVQPGPCEWTVRVISSSATNTRIERRYRRSATVVAGAMAECRLAPEHQIEVPGDRR